MRTHMQTSGTHTHIHMNAHTRTHKHRHIYVYIYVCIYVFEVSKITRTHINTRTHSYVNTYIITHILSCAFCLLQKYTSCKKKNVHVPSHARTHTHTNTQTHTPCVHGTGTGHNFTESLAGCLHPRAIVLWHLCISWISKNIRQSLLKEMRQNRVVTCMTRSRACKRELYANSVHIVYL